MKKVLLVILLMAFVMPAFAGDFVPETQLKRIFLSESINIGEGENFADNSQTIVSALSNKTCPVGYTANIDVRVTATLTPVE